MPDYTNTFYAIAVDRSGNTYAAGYADHTWGSPLHAFSGDNDIVVIKLNSRGVYQWHTFYGAAPTSGNDADDEANGLAVDMDGNVYLTGYSDAGWNVGAQSPLHPHDGIGENMFVLKLNTSGAYQWHTFYQTGRANAITLDSARNIYITGYSDAEFAGAIHSTAGNGRLVVLKFNSSGTLQWHTYYGVGGEEIGYSIATDTAGNVILAGTTSYPWQGGVNNNVNPLHAFSGGQGFSTDFVLIKFNSSGAYQWHTFYGASESDDYPASITTNGTYIYLAGYSYGNWGSPIHAHAAERDIAVLKLNASGQHQWHTFYGSNANDLGTGIATDLTGNLYISGYSSDSWTGDSGQAPKHAYSGTGGSDIVVIKLDSDGIYQRHTFYGASDVDDYTCGIAVDNSHEIYITGTSSATWQGDGNADPIHAYSGNDLAGDSYILKLSDFYSYIPYVRR